MTIDAVRAGYRVARGRARPRAPRDRPDRSRGFVHRAPPARGLRARVRAGAPVGSARVILAIDQGTTGTHLPRLRPRGADRGPRLPRVRAALPAARAGSSTTPSEIWEVTRRVAAEALAGRGRSRAPTSTAIGITNQRETVVAWDPATGEPVHRALVWQDRRTAARCDELREAGHEALVRERTGLVIDPYFSGTKIEWLLENVEAAARTPPSARSTPGSSSSSPAATLTDYSNASRTMLFDIRKLALGRRALRPARRRPGSAARAGAVGSEVYGTHRPSSAARSRSPGSPATSRRRSSARPASDPGDGQEHLRHRQLRAAEHRARGARAGRGPADDGRLGTRRARSPTRSRRRSSSPARRCSGCATASASSTTPPRPRRSRPRSTANDGVYFVPALTGLGSPHWDPYARGDDRRPHPRHRARAHLARAALEAIAYQTVDAVRAQEAAAGESVPALKADGGAVANRWLMQFQADVLGVPVIVPEVAETTALGAAYLAGNRHRRSGPRIRSARCGARPPFMSRGMAGIERDALARPLEGGGDALPRLGPCLSRVDPARNPGVVSG